MIEPDITGGLLGGALIGIAAAALLALNGRIAGISGILGGALRGPQRSWRVAFIAGLIVAGYIGSMSASINFTLQADSTRLIIAGILVGIGTRLGSGCTSGHGICGLARRSPRSLAATVIFMASAVLTVLIAGGVR